MIPHENEPDTGNGAMALSAGFWMSLIAWGIIILVWKVVS